MANNKDHTLRAITKEQAGGTANFVAQGSAPAITGGGDHDYMCPKCGAVVVKNFQPEAYKMSVTVQCSCGQYAMFET